jgi:hypothetical protein
MQKKCTYEIHKRLKDHSCPTVRRTVLANECGQGTRLSIETFWNNLYINNSSKNEKVAE